MKKTNREVLKISDLSLSFKTPYQRIRAVKNASFELYPGESVAIVGESGCGKSAMVKSILGLNPKETSKTESGSILYQGKDLLKLSEEELRKYRGQEIGMIFQDPMASLNPTMRIGHQIEESMILANPRISKEASYEEVISLLNLVGIPSPEKRFNLYPFELSGGMRQRVMIAISLAASPKVLIADEPTTALDVTIQAQILNQLQKIQKKMNMSIIFITHNLSLVAGFCQRIVVMYGGCIVESNDTESLFKNPRHPYTKKLLASIPSVHLAKDDRLTPIEGNPPSVSDRISGCMFHPRCPFATEICKKSVPELTEDSEGKVACHHVEKVGHCQKELLTLGEST